MLPAFSAPGFKRRKTKCGSYVLFSAALLSLKDRGLPCCSAIVICDCMGRASTVWREVGKKKEREEKEKKAQRVCTFGFEPIGLLIIVTAKSLAGACRSIRACATIM